MNVRPENDVSRGAAAGQLNNSDSGFNNAGFTLIELIVGITVMLFVMLSLVVFVSVGTRGYSTSNAEVSLQMESQIALNQVEDIVIEGAGWSGPLEINGCKVYSIMMTDQRILLILDSDNERLLEYPQDIADITDEHGNILDVSADEVQIAVGNYRDYMIAQGVTSFTLDDPQRDPEQPELQHSLIKVTMGFERGGKDRQISGSYRMRNFVAVEE